MKRVLLTLILLLCGTPAAWAATLYVDGGCGSVSTYVPATRACTGGSDVTRPTIQLAHNDALITTGAGHTIWVRSGTYTPTSEYTLTKNGASGARILLSNYLTEVPLIDGISLPAGQHGLRLNGANWWHVRGLELANAPAQGIYLEAGASNNIIERCHTHHNVRTDGTGAGIHLTDNAGGNNLILNNDSDHQSISLGGTGGDGFGITTQATGNILRGNRSWRNNDDGFDVSKSLAVLIEGNWSWENGFNDSLVKTPGNGAGYKLGLAPPPATNGHHVVRNNLSWGNGENGFDCNNANLPLMVYNNTSYDNNEVGSGNYYFGCGTTAYILQNNLAVNPSTAQVNGSVVHDHNSWGLSGFSAYSPPITASTADFVSIDFTANLGARQADGSLPVSTFLHLVAGSDLIDKGVAISPSTFNGIAIGGEAFTGTAPDLGIFEVAAAATPCTPIAVVMTGVVTDTGFAWITPETANRFGDPADASATPTQSTLRLFENGIELGPQHSAHADIRTIGLGKFSHFSGDAQATQYLLWSATDNSNVTTNGRAYTYTVDCVPVRALYHLDDASGTTAADSVGTFPGTLVNTPTWIAGKVNGALSLNGSTQYVSATSPNLTGAVTLAAWVRADSLAADYQTLLANYDAAAAGVQFDLSVTGGAASQGVGAFFYGYRLGANTRQFFSAANSITVAAGWLHLAVTDDGADTIQLYLNGSPVADTPSGTATSKPASAPGILAMGRAGGANLQYFNGDLDEVYLFDSALSPAQIAALAAIGADTTPPGAPTGLRVVSP